MNVKDDPKAKAAYRAHKNRALQRGIAFNFTFDEWAAVWDDSGKWSLRGRGGAKYAMCRARDQGAYESGNVYIATNSHNAQDKNAFAAPSLELASQCVINGGATVPAQVVASFASIGDAIKWSYENRIDPTTRTLSWMAQELGRPRSHISRLIHRQDLKLDAIESHVWDCLVGWTAIAQFVEVEKARMNQAAAETINNALKARFAA